VTLPVKGQSLFTLGLIIPFRSLIFLLDLVEHLLGLSQVPWIALARFLLIFFSIAFVSFPEFLNIYFLYLKILIFICFLLFFFFNLFILDRSGILQPVLRYAPSYFLYSSMLSFWIPVKLPCLPEEETEKFLWQTYSNSKKKLAIRAYHQLPLKELIPTCSLDIGGPSLSCLFSSNPPRPSSLTLDTWPQSMGITKMSVSFDGTRLISASKDSKVIIWDIQCRQIIRSSTRKSYYHSSHSFLFLILRFPIFISYKIGPVNYVSFVMLPDIDFHNPDLSHLPPLAPFKRFPKDRKNLKNSGEIPLRLKPQLKRVSSSFYLTSGSW